MKNSLLTQSIPGGFGAVCSAFIVSALQDMIPWLIVTFMVVLTDLFFGIKKSVYFGEKIRFSRAIRATMGKMVTYFAFVCMVVMINIASGKDWNIDVYSCLLICFIEFCSIISNILKPKGFRLDLIGVLGLFAAKTMKIDKEDIEDVIKEDDHGKETTTRNPELQPGKHPHHA